MTAIETYRLEVEAALGAPVSTQQARMYMQGGWGPKDAAKRIKARSK